MNVVGAKKPFERLRQDYERRFQMQRYGENNLYPQNLFAIVGASGTAMLCLNRYERFIEGYGLSEATAGIRCNRMGQTIDDILSLVAHDVAMFGGFALHVNYNVLGEVSEVQHVPFETCRLEEKDDAGHVAHILLHPDWQGNQTRNGERVRLEEKNIQRIPIYDPSVAVEQMEQAGGAAQYSGQILWCSTDGAWQYPTPIYDACVTEISTDEGLGNVKYRNVRSNFLVSCMLVTKKGLPKIDNEGNEEDRMMISDEDLKAFQGDEKLGKIMCVELENDEDEPKILPFPSRNFDKDYTATETSVIERIYAQFHQEIFFAIRLGKLGFSGSVMRDAYEYYAGQVTTEQRFIERNLEKVFSHWQGGALTDFSILPQRYMTTEDRG